MLRCGGMVRADTRPRCLHGHATHGHAACTPMPHPATLPARPRHTRSCGAHRPHVHADTQHVTHGHATHDDRTATPTRHATHGHVTHATCTAMPTAHLCTLLSILVFCICFPLFFVALWSALLLCTGGLGGDERHNEELGHSRHCKTHWGAWPLAPPHDRQLRGRHGWTSSRSRTHN